MKRFSSLLIIFLLTISGLKATSPANPIFDWRHTARIVGADFWMGFGSEAIHRRIDLHAREGVSVLLVWSYISNGYRWTEKDRRYLTDIANYIHTHYPDMHVIVYIAPLEIVTFNADMDMDGKPDPGKRTVFTEHPEWLQIGLNGLPAVFYGALAFWLTPSSEDARLCPNDPEYRKIWYRNFVELAKTGIDGVWWDVPFFINDFGDHWEDQWPCHCDDCQRSFNAFSGHFIPDTINWKDPLWRKFIDWRFLSIASFIKNCKNEAKKINPGFMLINETWDPNDNFDTEVGFSSHFSRLFNCNDGIAHEFASSDPEYYFFYPWLVDTAEGIIYRGVDQNRASWILSYSHNPEHAKTRAATVLFTGCNFYETNYFDMASTAGLEVRTLIFHWIKNYQDYYYNPYIRPYVKTAVLRSFPSFKYFGLYRNTHFAEFLGTTMMLLESHIPFEVLPDDLLEENLKNYEVLILPSVIALGDREIETIKNFVMDGGKLITMGITGRFSENGSLRKSSVLSEVCGNPPPKGVHINKYGKGICVSTRNIPGSLFYEAIGGVWIEGDSDSEEAERQRKFFLKKLWKPLNVTPLIRTTAPRSVLFNTFLRGNEIIVRVLNLSGLRLGIFTPEPVHNIKFTLTIPDAWRITETKQVEFLGQESPLSCVQKDEKHVVCEFSINRHKILHLKSNFYKKLNPRK